MNYAFLASLVASVAFSTQARAQSSCLQSATNAELMAEVQRRMLPDGGSQGLLDVVASCNMNELTIDVADVDTGRSSNVKIGTASSTDCRNYASAISQKSPKLKAGGRVAACDFHFLSIVTITRSGALSVNQVQTSSSTDCRDQAAVINR